MKDRHAAGRPPSLGVSARWPPSSHSPVEPSVLIMATADAVAIPTALWAALALKFDRLDPALERTLAYFLVAVASALLFLRGTRSVPRGDPLRRAPRRWLTVVAGVSLSVAGARGVRPFCGQPADSADGVRHLLGTRACCTWGAAASWPAICCSCTWARTATPSREWRSTAPAMAGARVSSVLRGGPGLRAGGVYR